MNFHVTTPTGAKAIARHRAFHQAIERKAAELQSSKLLCALRSQSRPAAIAPLQPEAIPAEPDPPALPALPISVCNRITAIQKLVCESFSIGILDLRGDRRDHGSAMARLVAMYLCRRLTPHSLPRIGKSFGRRDHSTAFYAIARVMKILAAPKGSDLSYHWPAASCDLVREKVPQIIAAFVDIFPEDEI